MFLTAGGPYRFLLVGRACFCFCMFHRIGGLPYEYLFVLLVLSVLVGSRDVEVFELHVHRGA